MENRQQSFEALYATISRLRDSGGCPWDRKQTPVSLKKYLLEENTELIEAIDSGDALHICEEMGDLLFLLLLLARIHAESGDFTMTDVLEGINQKMIRRHPHVFGDSQLENEADLRAQWEKIKSEEKRKK